MSFRYAEFNILETSWLPQSWDEQILEVSTLYSKCIHLDGKSSTSREPVDTQGVNCNVVSGEIVYQKIRWLYDLYRNQFAELAFRVNEGEILLSTEINTGVNINVISGMGARYEWHIDTNPLTGILFVTSHSDEDGGQLLFKTLSGDHLVTPKSGMFILFDAREIPHTVLPLKKEIRRISIPMNYYTPEFTLEKVRPADLSSYCLPSN